MTLTRLLTAAGFAAVLAVGSSAYAQSADTDTTVHVDEHGNVTTTTTIETPGLGDPTVTTSANSAVSAGMPASSVVSTTGIPGTLTVSTVTNGPVPDTAENRARYGQPLSRAGKRTAPAGN